MVKSLWIEYCTHWIPSPRQICPLNYGFGQTRWWFMGVILFPFGWVHFCAIGVIWEKLTSVNLNNYGGGRRIPSPGESSLACNQISCSLDLEGGSGQCCLKLPTKNLPQGVGASLWPQAGTCSSRIHFPNHRDCRPAAHPLLSSLFSILQRSEPK